MTEPQQQSRALEQLRAQPARPLCNRFESEFDIEPFLEQHPEADAAALTQHLLEQHALRDAVVLISQAIEAREAVWWSWEVARNASPSALPKKQQDVLDAVAEWLVAPTDEKRRTAHEKSELAELDNPPGCVGLATFYAEGGLGPADLEEVPAPPGVAGLVASGGIMLAATLIPLQADQRTMSYIEKWFELAERERPWTTGTTQVAAQPEPRDDHGYTDFQM